MRSVPCSLGASKRQVGRTVTSRRDIPETSRDANPRQTTPLLLVGRGSAEPRKSGAIPALVTALLYAANSVSRCGAWRASQPSSRLARLRLWLRRGRWLVAPERERRRSGASPHHSLGRILGLITPRREKLPLNAFTGHATDYAANCYRLSKRHNPLRG